VGTGGRAIERTREDLLRRLAVNDAPTLTELLGAASDPGREWGDGRVTALVQLGGLVALTAAPPSYQWSVAQALAAGVREDEIVDVLIALLPVVGVAHVQHAAVEVARALGHEPGTDRDGMKGRL
jgi:alkylhydroperoxidase/carboxymuconolactone decarboxylase family protein YurZ